MDIKVPDNGSGKHEVTKENWSTLLNKNTIISQEPVYVGWYFWGQFDESGIKYSVSPSADTPPSYDNKKALSLSGSVFANNVATFSGKNDAGGDQDGTVKFQLDDNGIITNVIVRFTSVMASEGSPDYLKDKDINCGKPKEHR